SIGCHRRPGGFAATPPGTIPLPNSEPHFRGANGNECRLSKLWTGSQTLSVHCALLWWRLSSGGAEKTGPRTCRRKASQACRRALPCVLSVTGTARGQNGADVTLTRFPKLDPRIVLDAKWPIMYRIRLPDGGLSDMLNLTRAHPNV